MPLDLPQKKANINIRRRSWKLNPDPSHVICRPHIPGGHPERIRAIIGRVLNLTDLEADSVCAQVMLDFSERHRNLPGILENHYAMVERYIPTDVSLTRSKRVLIGAYFTMEYAVSAAALFNPSIVRHPDQSDLQEGELRFVMSVRAVGEGHISSLAFRSGIIRRDGSIDFDKVTDYVETPRGTLHTSFKKSDFDSSLACFDIPQVVSAPVLDKLADRFDLAELEEVLNQLDTEERIQVGDQNIQIIQWLAYSNYEIDFERAQTISERVIFPVSPSERAGMEDARFVEFINDQGESRYYGTYTAYDGKNIMPQFIETEDFSHFKISSVNGKSVKNKGIALFPRKVNGRYLMLGRLDGENNYLLSSDDMYCWKSSVIIQEPAEPWEFIQLGNCGSPIETPEGWLVLTHGVGPMREYSISAILLDIDEPHKVIAKLRTPLLRPHEEERAGYVPNVVYSCGAILHEDELYLPYAMSDISCGMVSLNVYELINSMDRCEAGT